MQGQLPLSLQNLLTFLWKLECFLTCWRLLKSILLYKSGCCKGLKNCRPTFLLSISNIYEPVMPRRLYSYLEKYHLLYDKPYGFCQKHWTKDVLAELTAIICMGSKETFIMSVFLHLKNAFDTLDHLILLDELEAHGARKIANKWFQNYQIKRKQFVEVNGQASDWAIITTRIPQGSVSDHFCSWCTSITLLKQFGSRTCICLQTIPTLRVFVRLPQAFKMISPIYTYGSFPISYL